MGDTTRQRFVFKMPNGAEWHYETDEDGAAKIYDEEGDHRFTLPESPRDFAMMMIRERGRGIEIGKRAAMDDLRRMIGAAPLEPV